MTMNLETIATPCLVLDRARMERNIARLRGYLAHHGVVFRPHVKTCKSVEITRLMTDSPAPPITVSTLREAEYFSDHGFQDITYAVAIAPQKVPQVIRLRRRGARLAVILDSLDATAAVVRQVQSSGESLDVLIEIDCDGYRSGVAPDDPVLVEVAKALVAGGMTLAGVISHAGHSYGHVGVAAIREVAARERAATVFAAERLRDAGLPCPVVSVGSTPTALCGEDFSGVTEVRAGVFVFFDLVMAGLEVCRIDDIALSVLTTVIGHRRERGWTIVDAGWMALSRDRGTAPQSVDQGYGLVCDLDGRPIADLLVASVNQEHGIVARRAGSHCPVPELPIGTRLRVLPNHACATAAQHDFYYVTEGSREVTAVWPRIRGW